MRKIKNVLTLIIFAITVVLTGAFLGNTVEAAGAVNASISSCQLGSGGIDVEHSMTPVAGTYTTIDVSESVTVNGSNIYNEPSAFFGNLMTCAGANTCACEFGGSCPPGQSFSATTNTEGATVVATITYRWNHSPPSGVPQYEEVTSTATCTTPVPPPPLPECSDPISWLQNPTYADCGGECDSGSYCVVGPPDYRNRCQPSNVCTSPPDCGPPVFWHEDNVDPSTCGQGGCLADQRCETNGGVPQCVPRSDCNAYCGPTVYWYTTTVDPSTCGQGICAFNERCESNGGPPTCNTRVACDPPDAECTGPISGTPSVNNCGLGGCGSTEYCTTQPPFNVPTCVEHDICGGTPPPGPGAGLGEECDEITIFCEDPSHECLYNLWANKQICLSQEPICDVGPVGDQTCQGICNFGGYCVPLDATNVDAGGTCDCTTAPGGISDEKTYFDEEVEPSEYIGPIVDYQELITNAYSLTLPLALGVGGIPIVLFAGYKVMTSQGEPGKLSIGKEDLTAGVVGILYLLLSLTILRIILNNFLGN